MQQTKSFGGATSKKHPVQLYFISTLIACETFSFYGMKGILTYYFTEALNFSDQDAIGIAGGFVATFFIFQFLGSTFVDKFLDNKLAVLIGALGVMFGHIMMSITSLDEMFSYGLASIIFGGAFLRVPAVSLIGECYKEDDPRRTSAFTILHVIFNFGITLALLSIGPVARAWGWHYGFGIAAVVMFFGGVFYIAILPSLRNLGFQKKQVKKIYLIILAVLYIFFLYCIAEIIMRDVLRKGMIAFVSVIAVSILSYIYLSSSIKQRFSLIKIMFILVVSIFTTAVLWQYNYGVALFVKRNVYRVVSYNIFGWKLAFEIAPSALTVINPLVAVIFGIAVNQMWRYFSVKGIVLSYIQKTLLYPIVLMLGFSMLYGITYLANENAQIHYSLFLAVLGIMTLSEFFAQPICFAVITNEAPKKYMNVMIAIYKMSLGISTFLASQISGIMAINPKDVSNAFTSLKIYKSGFKTILLWGIVGATLFVVIGLYLDYYLTHKEKKITR